MYCNGSTIARETKIKACALRQHTEVVLYYVDHSTIPYTGMHRTLLTPAPGRSTTVND